MQIHKLVAVFLTFSLALPAKAQDVISLQPTSTWALNYAEEYCELARVFGEGNRSVTLTLRSYEPEGRFYLLLSGPLARPASSADRIEVAFAEVESWESTFVAGEVAGRPVIMFKPVFSFGPLSEEAEQRMEANLPVVSYSEPEIEAGIETIEFLDGLEREFVLQTGSMGEPMVALRECARGIADSWGVTFNERQQLSRVAIPQNNRPFITERQLERHFAPGAFISILLIVDEGGRVDDCRISGTQSASDTEAVCDRARERLRFDPALDADRNPARDYWLITHQR